MKPGIYWATIEADRDRHDAYPPSWHGSDMRRTMNAALREAMPRAREIRDAGRTGVRVFVRNANDNDAVVREVRV